MSNPRGLFYDFTESQLVTRHRCLYDDRGKVPGAFGQDPGYFWARSLFAWGDLARKVFGKRLWGRVEGLFG